MRYSYTMRNRYTVIGIGWLLLLATFALVLTLAPFNASTLAVAVFTATTQYWWGPLLFLSAYIVRPLVWLPISIFSVVSGTLFGVWPGLLVTLLGTIISGVIAYLVGRYFANALPVFPIITRLTTHKKYPFELIASLHFSFLSFDAINYAAGLTRIPFWPFFFGMIIGMLPGTFSLTLLGASIDIPDIIANGITTQSLDWRYLSIAAVCIISVWTISFSYRRYTKCKKGI